MREVKCGFAYIYMMEFGGAFGRDAVRKLTRPLVLNGLRSISFFLPSLG